MGQYPSKFSLSQKKKLELFASSHTISNPSLQALNDSAAADWDLPCIILIPNPAQSSSFDM